jgi:tetratricopeptide (TPR) repeat protein
LLVALPLHAQDFSECSSIEVVDYEAAVAVCTELLEIDPLNVDAYFSRAYAQNELGNYEESILDYTKVLLMNPKYTIAYNNRGYAYAQLGDQESAIADYTRALLTDSTYSLALLNRAYSYLAIDDLDSVLADAEQLATIDPGNIYVYDLRGNVFIEQEAYDDAIDAYTTYIDLAPDDPSGYLTRGFVYWRQDEDELAAPDYLVWVETNAPNDISIDPDDALEPLTITLEEGSHFVLAIEGEEGDLLTASAIGQVETVDPVLILLNEDGDPITVDDDSAGGIAEVDAIIENFELPEDGEYTLVIGYAGGGANGDVRLDVRLNSGA